MFKPVLIFQPVVNVPTLHLLPYSFIAFSFSFSPHPMYMYFGGVVKMFMSGLDERGDVRVGGGC